MVDGQQQDHDSPSKEIGFSSLSRVLGVVQLCKFEQILGAPGTYKWCNILQETGHLRTRSIKKNSESDLKIVKSVIN